MSKNIEKLRKEIETIEISSESDESIISDTKVAVSSKKSMLIQNDSVKSSSSNLIRRMQKTNRHIAAMVEMDDYEDDNDDDDEEYDNSSHIKLEKTNSKKRKAKSSSKKDDWNDDESHDSVSSCDLDSDTEKEPERVKIDDNQVLEFFNKASQIDFQSMTYINDLKMEKLLSLRPFADISDVKSKLHSNSLFYTYNSVKEFLFAREVVSRLLKKCKEISQKITKQLSQDNLSLTSNKQPNVLNKKMVLKPYQLIGLNWLCFMYEQKLNAVLSDEMGLGKTCQTIAFLAYLYEINSKFLHLIVVPSSTLENWSREIENWFPEFNFIIYRGSPEERRVLRKEINSMIKKKSGLNAILTTYSFVGSNDKDKEFFRSIKLEYCIYDEAHVLKNMKSLKYDNLIRIKSKRKLLLTGTPLQNNIVELMSLLYFVATDIFKNKQTFISKLFFPRQNLKENVAFYNQNIEQAKGIMEPFLLRRLKVDVLKELPEKSNDTVICKMSPRQEFEYQKLLDYYKKRKIEVNLTKDKNLKTREDGILGVLTELRKAANHPLLRRCIYNDEKIREMAQLIMKESDSDTRYDYVVEDMTVMNDYELHGLCSFYEGLKGYELSNEDILNSGKFDIIKGLLEEFKAVGDRVIIFSQYKIMLDILEEFLKIIGHKYLRLDGCTKVEERQPLIDKFQKDKKILVFMLTTKAGGVGINLTGANRVIMHDIDYNPQNDKQAEDRCHRVGQLKEVQVYKLISKNSIDETMLAIQAKKLELDADLSEENSESAKKMSIMKMMKDVLN